MNKKLLFTNIILCLIFGKLRAQEPDLSIKDNLTIQLHGEKLFNNATEVDTLIIPYNLSNHYTLEIKAAINSAVGRGLDIEARRNDLSGFRTSADTQSFNWNAPLGNLDFLYFSSKKEQTFRFAVDGNQVHIYQNGHYLTTKPTNVIYNISNGVENTVLEGVGENLISGVLGGEEIVTPDEIGWGNNGSGNVPWNTTNGNSGVRIMKPLNNTSYMGESYTEAVLLIRWESGVTNGSSYYYPVELEANTSYKFSYLQGYLNNGTPNSFNVSVRAGLTGETINQTSFEGSANEKNQLFDGSLMFTTEEAGTYYLMFQNNGAGIWLLGEPQLKKFNANSRILIGKNYEEGVVDMKLISATLDDNGAYAPDPTSGDGETISRNFLDENFTTTRLINSRISIDGKSEFYLNGENPLVNSTIDLKSNESWIYFSEYQPSQFIEDLSGFITVNGRNFDKNIDRVEIYASGCVVIPNGMEVANENALVVYSETNFGGESKSMAIETYYNELASWDNRIKSFKLKKGFSATFANNSNGTGHSRMFIASDEDLEVAEVPEGFIASGTTNESFISFVRVFPWRWTSKKGTAGVPAGELYLTNPTIFYDWSAGGQSTIDVEYVPMRHNAGWDSYSKINSRTNTSHVLGFNEPERTDQANLPVSEAVRQWPSLFESGLRIGSPAPASMPRGWLTEFLQICDSTNMRVDFIAPHGYQDQGTGWWDWYIEMSANGGMAQGQTPRRPIWFTEWNNGANWTNNADANKWPDPMGLRLDVNGDPILDQAGNEVTVSLPLTPANAERQKNKLLDILNHFESKDILEHQFLYQWVNDARSLELEGELTPAGKAFAAFKSEVGFKKKNEYIHEWKIAPPFPRYSESQEDPRFITLWWYDHNGETGNNYIIERKLASESSFSAIDTIYGIEDYEYGSRNVQYIDSLGLNSASYRIKATSYKATESIYSRSVNVTRNALPGTPDLSAEPLTSTVIELFWNEIPNVIYYTLKRSESEEGEYTVVAEVDSEVFEYKDEGLESSTTYFYKISASSSGGEGEDSDIVSVTTRSASAIPDPVENFRAASGDGKVSLLWKDIPGLTYRISRSEVNGTKDTVLVSEFSGEKFVDSTVINATNYQYKIIAKNSNGSSDEQKANASPNKGQLLRLLFDENEGIYAYDDWGAKDGVLINGVEWIDGIDNSGIKLSSANNSFVELGDDILVGLDSFTISTWFYFPDTNGSNARMFDFGTGTADYMCMIPRSDDDKVFFVLNTPNGNYENKIDYVIPSNEWFHFAITFTSTSYNLYINGELIGEDNGNINNFKPSDIGTTSQNWLGRSQWTDAWANNAYDDFRIYNYALDREGIEMLYESSFEQSPNIYEISFSSDFGELPQKLEFSSDDEYPDLPTIGDTGTHLFKGWQNGEGEWVTNLSEIIPDEGSYSTTLYAVWEEKQNKYEVSYMNLSVEGVYNPNPNQQDFGKELVLQEAFAKGYLFMGWYLNSDFTGEVSRITAENIDDITLYARWKLRPQFIVWPTITSGIINLRSVEDKDLIFIFNSNGVLVKKIQTNAIQNTYNLSNLSSGLYFIKSHSSGQTVKIIKK